jgi:NSS family neurotransmitter:Na+ symporter
MGVIMCLLCYTTKNLERGFSFMGENRVRESLGSRLGFIFLAAGCAIGLGNVWRFPYITGRYGGAAFVMVYLVCLIFIALPILIMEFSVGRGSQQSNIGSFEKLQPKGTYWSIWGYLGVGANFLLMMFYTTVSGWMIAYTWYYIVGSLDGMSPDQVGVFFGGLLSDPYRMTFWLFVTVAFGAVVCAGGLRKSVEPVTKIMMSGLFIILIALAWRSLNMSGAEKGIEFYLKPDFSKLSLEGLRAALGQAFFTLSVGIGSMAIFGSYIGRERSLTGEAVIVTGLDTTVSFCSGLIIFATCFTYDVAPNAGPGLIFVTLPNMFNNMDNGRLWGSIFFLFMSLAAVSTVVAVFELIVASFIDRLGWSRKKASIATFVSIFVLSLPCVFGFNIWSSFEPLGKGTAIIDLEDFLVSDNLLPIGAMVYLLFCTTRYGWGWDNFIAEANAGKGMRFAQALRPFLTVVVPLVIIAIMAGGYWDKFFK